MDKPSPKAVQDAAGISPSYASMILAEGPNGRVPPRPLAIVLFRKLGWRHPVLDGLSDEQIDLLEQIEPWTPPSDRQPVEQAA